ncbi:PEP-CTERM sorting domain-containing protein [sulfur-oxidizing endosymbiont of Gigantopelta aegis]|uniref:PEP-CTERM sorting domain-containing protein n=1 Tax=sulfur-oxidizing endosymbiont of Gigantopelta aegis TaxID=2794934 RepID=UPI0018DB92E4|nr:PEP-CTERM sorting domain-containing protein [sulfur-oxidizing endosymbiont of Gigantopelta aegis]
MGDVTFDPTTQLFTWDTTGFAPGSYVANIRATDVPGGLTDVGRITINVLAQQTPPQGIPEPAPLAMMLLGLIGLRYAKKSVK